MHSQGPDNTAAAFFSSSIRAKLLTLPSRRNHQALGASMSLGDKVSTYGLLGLGSVLGMVGVVVSILKQFTTILG